ncbi:MAG: 4Fe-4S dicluster domain-containing protein [Vicinamibacteria bacterium]
MASASAAPRFSGHNTRRRRLIQWGFLAVFVALPLFDLLRFDFASARLLVVGQEIWLDEWALLWLVLMFAMWLVGAVSLVFGRVYCAYACPQTVFSEIAHDFDAFGMRLTRGFEPRRRAAVARAISLGLLALVSLAASVLFMAYFAPLPDVIRRLLSLDFGPWVGAVGAFSTLLAFLVFGFVREDFCRTACPYGLLMGVLEDGRSLHVAFDETSGKCIDCGACERVCPMGIDIRQGSFQIECTRCGSCIDACDRILTKLKRPGLLGFELPGFSWRALDAKRALVSFATLGFGVVLVWAVARRERVAIHLSPVYSDARPAEDTASTRFVLRAANRGREPLSLEVSVEGLPGAAAISGLEDTLLPPGQERRFDVVVSMPLAEARASVVPFTWVIRSPEGTQRFAASIFARQPKKAS